MRMFERSEIDVTKYRSGVIRNFFGTEREARREYSRMRSIAEKRLDRLEKAAGREGDIIQRDARRVIDKTGDFPKLAEVEGQEVYTQLERVARFLNSVRSSVSTLRESKEKQIESLKENEVVKNLIRSARRSAKAEDAEDVFDDRNASAAGEADYEEDLDDDVSDAEADAFMGAVEVLDELGLGYAKYNERVMDYVLTHLDSSPEEMAKTVNLILQKEMR